jgi:hypothetical protein
MKEQVEHLLAVTSAIDVTIQVADMAAARPVLNPSSTMLSFADGMDSVVPCWEGSGGQVSITSRDDDVRAACATFDAPARTALSPHEVSRPAGEPCTRRLKLCPLPGW